MIDLAGVDTLRIWQWDGNQVNYTDIGEVNVLAQYKIAQVNETTLAIAGLDGERIIIHESNLSAVDWSEVFNQPMGLVDEQTSYLLFEEDTIIVQGNSSNSGVLLRIEGQWNRSLRDLPIGNNPSLLRVGDTLHITTSDPLLGHLVWTTTTILEEVLHPYNLLSVEAYADVPILLGLNDSLAMAWHDSTNQDLELLRFIPDTDGDLIPDTHDAMPLMSGQWSDQDGDGFGDNDLGPLADTCPNTAGTSLYVSRGCLDSDQDGYSDLEDQCIDALGLAWWGRIGCFDLDQDGWADNDAFFYKGDKYPTNWKQSIDSDGDGFGDNHGPDCCDTLTDNFAPPDLFPYNRYQWVDVDGDGYGDNYSHFESGDQCIWIAGDSWRDRNGCLDSDGDGVSDPSNIGNKDEWNVSHGADVWINDSTQWADSDGDGFGDNSSDNATNPDKFRTIKAAAYDSDNDGFPDNWTVLWDGSNHGDLIRDYCPSTAGSSLYPAGGCVDRDGDYWADNDDAFPDDDSQWNDSDGDGFGDNQAGANYDICVDVPGVAEGTHGPGCPVVSTDDSDGDGVFNAVDFCPDTEVGSLADGNGCSDEQKDDDQDNYNNAIDICPSTEYEAIVDSQGCSIAQREADTDGDGIPDLDDLCADTQFSEYDDIDADGCGISQRDSDADGVMDIADDCPDTQAGYPVDLAGCVDEVALNQDLDGDGFSGVYSFDGVNHIGDAFPLDFTQWQDSDDDGYGDNQSGNYSDSCPLEVGNSTMQGVYGCIDDGDGYADYLEPESLRGDYSQWNDSDFDTYGDNIEGNNPDLCPGTDYNSKAFVDENGCAKYQLDSDSDGISDDSDNCPNTGLGKEVYPDGCPVPGGDSSISGDDMIMGFSPLTFSIMAISGVIGSLLVIMILLRVLRGKDAEDWDEDDEDNDYDDYEGEDDVWASLAKNKEKSPPPKSIPVERGLDPKGPARGPSPAGPPRGVSNSVSTSQSGPPRGPPNSTSTPQRGPPRGPPNSASTPQRSAVANSPQQSPPPQKGRNAPSSQIKSTRKIVAKERINDVVGSTNVRKTKAVGLFRDDKKAEMEAAVEWAIIARNDGESERMIMMSLQETGWSAPQSRSIYERTNS